MTSNVSLKIIAAAFVLIAQHAFAFDTSVEERTCRDIGFKPKTEKFGTCVMELYERRSGIKPSGSAQTRPKEKSSIQTSSGTRPTGPTQTSQKENTNVQTSSGDGSADDQTCQSYGFRPGQEGYSNCRMQIDQAKREAAAAQSRYQQELAAYEERTAELKRQQERARAMRQLELGLRMMGGQPPIEAINSLGTGAPISRPSPPALHQSIRLPNGRIMNCNTFGNHTHCN